MNKVNGPLYYSKVGNVTWWNDVLKYIQSNNITKVVIISGVHKKLGHLFKSGGMHFLLERVACRTMANHGERSKFKHIKVSFYDGLPPQAHSGRDGPKKKWPVNRRYV